VSVLDEKKSANIPPRECEACTLSKRVICIGHRLVRRGEGGKRKKKRNRPREKLRKDRQSRINSTKKETIKNEREGGRKEGWEIQRPGACG
jgi:hypothetical protein